MALARRSVTLLDVGLLLIRLMLAVVGVAHGSQKLFGAFGGSGIEGFAKMLAERNVPAPGLSAYLSALAEFAGGLLIGLGLLTRFGAAIFGLHMLTAVYLVHRRAFFAQNDGMEYPLTLAVVALALVLTGPGRLSLDDRLFGRRAALKAPPRD